MDTTRTTEGSRATLGELLYGKLSRTPCPEQDWLGLLRATAAGDALALQALYERTHRLVFTLVFRILGQRETAEELLLDFYLDLRRRASRYDLASGPVLGWIMRLARARAVERLRFEQLRSGAPGFRPLFAVKAPSRVLLRPAAALKARLAQRIAAEAGGEPRLPAQPQPRPAWEEVAPRISCMLLGADAERHIVSMLVRLAPGGEYPPHTHAGVEELHLLAGELRIGDRRLLPGDYSRAEPGTVDHRVWSETGCTCVLFTSTQDALSG